MSELSPSQPPPTNRTGGITLGVILVGIGVIFLLQNLGWFYFNNWWALFILLGTAGAWGNAWKLYQKNGQRITKGVVGAFMGGIFPLIVALIFLFDLNWGDVWPVFLIAAGIAVLARSFAVPD